jgi:acetyltransferase-like isoleucine patch superfamily enzyme
MASFGRRSLLYRPAWVFHPEKMSIGEDVWISQGAWFEIGEPAFDAPSPVLVVGDRVIVRHHCTISAAERVEIEDDVLIAGYVSIFDSDHTMGGRGNPVWNPQVTSPVRIGSGSWLGERVTVLRGADVGRRCVIGAHSVVKGTIPDYSVAVGAPAVVVGSTRAAFEVAAS